MAYAVTHIIAGILGAELISKFVIKKEIPFRYYVLSGVAGLLPDIDVLFYPIAKRFLDLVGEPLFSIKIKKIFFISISLYSLIVGEL